MTCTLFVPHVSQSAQTLFYIFIYVIYTTTKQCKLKNKCSFVCVHISKCLVGRGKHHQCKLQWTAAGWMQVMRAP